MDPCTGRAAKAKGISEGEGLGRRSHQAAGIVTAPVWHAEHGMGAQVSEGVLAKGRRRCSDGWNH